MGTRGEWRTDTCGVDYDVGEWPRYEHDLRRTGWQDERDGGEVETERDREIEREYNGEE